MKIVDLKAYKLKKKNQTWLYKISFHELFSEFIETYQACEKKPEDCEISHWLDMVSDALNERFFQDKNIKINP